MAEVVDGAGPAAGQATVPSVATGVEAGGNKFQHAISAWRSTQIALPSRGMTKANSKTADVDLTALTSDLDNTASEIVAYQRDSTVQRKELAQKTKDFRKLDDSNKLTEIKSLLKGSLDAARLYYKALTVVGS